MQNPYSVLGVTPHATLKEIKKAYLRPGLRYHLDRQVGKSAMEQAIAAAKFRDVKATYDLLVSQAKKTNPLKVDVHHQPKTDAFATRAPRSWRPHHNAYFKQAAYNLVFREAKASKLADHVQQEFLLLMEGLSWHYITDDVIASRCADALAILKTRPDLADVAASCLIQAVIMHGDHVPIVNLMQTYLAIAPQSIKPEDFKTLVNELGWDYLSLKTLRRHSSNIIAILVKRPDLATANAAMLMQVVSMHGNDEKIIAILDLLLEYAPQAITPRDFSTFVHAMGREHQTEGKLAVFGRNIAIILEKRLDLATCAEFAMMKVVKAYGTNSVVQHLSQLFKEIAVQNLLLQAVQPPSNIRQYN